MRISVNTKPLVDCLARWSWINCPSKTKGQKPTKCSLTKKLDKLNTLFSLMLIRSLTLYRFGSNLNIRCKQAWDKVYNRTLKRKHGRCFTWVWFPHRHDLPWQNWPMKNLFLVVDWVDLHSATTTHFLQICCFSPDSCANN